MSMNVCNECIHSEVCGEPTTIYGLRNGCSHFINKTELNLYDKCEIIEGCTVEILTNTATGAISVGWWRGGIEDRPGMKGE